MMEYCEVIKITILKIFHEMRKYNSVVSMNLYIHYNSHFEKNMYLCMYIGKSTERKCLEYQQVG